MHLSNIFHACNVLLNRINRVFQRCACIDKTGQIRGLTDMHLCTVLLEIPAVGTALVHDVEYVLP